MMDWLAAQDAIQAAVVEASSLLGARVRWERASRDQPGTAGDVVILGLSGEQTDGPEYTDDDNPTPSPGAEILLETAEQIDLELSIDYYSMAPDGARAALQRVLRNLRRESVQEALELSGIAVVRVHPAQHLPALLETEFRDRARGMVTLRCADGTSSPETFIESAPVVGSYV